MFAGAEVLTSCDEVKPQWSELRILNLYCMKTFFLSVIFLLTGWCQAQAQPYGDEWINYSQSYYKVFVGSEGIYRITQEALSAAGVPVASIDPRGLQIIWRGQEQHIFVSGESDGSFDPGDFIEFYGTYNDGELDRELYRTPQEQPHTYMSLYQDSSVYFITWNNAVQGKRMGEQNDVDFSGLSPSPWYMHETMMWFNSQWFDGAPYADQGFFSEYTDGEGWMSANVVGSYRSFNLSTPFFNNAGPAAKAYVLAYGKSDPTNPGDFDPQGNNHEFEVSVGTGSTLQVLETRRHRGYTKLEFPSLTIPANVIGAQTRFNFRSIFGARGRHAVALIKLEYPRNYNLGNSSRFAFNDESGNSYAQWLGYPSTRSNPVVYDLLRKERIKAELSSGQLRYKRSGIDSTRIVIQDVQDMVLLTDIRLVPFQNYDFSATSYDYYILTHTSLDSGAQAYKQYRESAEGGAHQVYIAYADLLYDQFYYGIHHPLALRRFNFKFYNTQTSKPEYMLLLGRGQLYNRVSTNAIIRNLADLVPTIGNPASDYMLATTDLKEEVVPVFNIGRVPAKNNTEVMAYLEKLKQWEQNLHQNQNWTKNVLHLAGGGNASESQLYQGYLRNFAGRIQSDSFAGKVRTITKEVSAIDKSLTEVIIDEMNQGVSFMTYFGHGSSLILEIDIGDVQLYRNMGKTPFFHFNGCVLGNTFEISSLAEGFLLEPNKGALGWLAGSSFGFTNELFNYSRNFYDDLLKNNYGEPISKSIQSSMRKYYNRNNLYSLSMCRQYLFHGDPALRIFSPNKPDFKFLESSIKSNALNRLNAQDPVEISVDVANLGKFYADSVAIQITREGISGEKEVSQMKIRIPGYSAPLTLELPVDSRFKGLNRIRMEIDPMNQIEEFNLEGESNNTLNYEFFFPSEGLAIVSPLKNEIVNNTLAEVKVQLDDFMSEEKEIIFQLDTSPWFNSPFLKTERVTGNGIISASFPLLPKDSIDYFWRAAISDTVLAFERSQFCFVYDAAKGFGQTHPFSFQYGKARDMYFDSASASFEFENMLSATFTFQAHGGRGPSSRNIRWSGNVVHMASFIGNGVWLVAFNPVTEERFILESSFALKQPVDAVTFGYWWYKDHPYYQRNAYSGMFHFNTTIKDHRDSLLVFLNRIPDGYHLMMINGVNTGITSWEDTLFNALLMYGIVGMRENVKEQYPFGIKGQKGAKPGEALEFYPDLTDPVTPPDQQSILNSLSFSVKKYRGQLESELIGPAQSWQRAYYRLRLDEGDAAHAKLIGLDRDLNEFELIPSLDEHSDISAIDASVYPYLKFRFDVFDSLYRTPPQPDKWIVNFVPMGDVTINKDQLPVLRDTFIKGQNFVFSIGVSNLSHPAYETVRAQLVLSRADGTVVEQWTDTIASLGLGNDTLLSFPIATSALQGDYILKFVLNEENSPIETSLANNQFVSLFHVRENGAGSPLDLKVDGRYITHRELVSSSPLFELRWIQNDSFFMYNRLDLVQLELKYPGTDSFVTLDLDAEEVSFSPAGKYGDMVSLSLEKPLPLDGEYTLVAKVQSPYNQRMEESRAVFRVVNESSISEVFNYPNPFTTSTRFVFDMTGEEPVDVHISVYNISGRQVKTIVLPKEELHIGSNLSSYAWDGRDEFGDQLANGVYLYKVSVGTNPDVKTTQHSVLEAGQKEMFLQEFGKMYIMR